MRRGGRTLDDEIRSENTHGSNTDTRLGSSVRGAKAGEDDGCSAAHGAEEGLIRWSAAKQQANGQVGQKSRVEIGSANFGARGKLTA